jgi:hypothetical protein
VSSALLLGHHRDEEQFSWPLLAARAPRAARLLALLEAEHSGMHALIVQVRDRDVTRPVRSAAMSRLSEAVLAHLEEEDRSLFGLLAAHMTAADQRPGPAWSRATIPPADERRVLAMMLAVAGEDERARLFAASRDPVVAAWSGTEARALIEVHRVLAAVAARRPAGTTPQSAPPVPARSRSRHEGEPSETR